MKDDFGIFNPVFESAHGYLALLNLSANDAAEAVERVRDCCRSVANPYPDICRLLTDVNWRPHLVATVAMIVSGHNHEAVKQLWHRLDRGSWVTPQLGVALFLVDPDFQTQSRIRLEAGCPLDISDLLSMVPLERHSAVDPAGRVHRSAKAAATLLYLLRITSPVPSWVEQVEASEEIRTLLAEEIDGASRITNTWLKRITAISK